VILVVDVTVTGPDVIMTGSATANVTVPAAEAPPAEPPAAVTRSQQLRWSGR
jgi:hypothetical protein